MKINIEIDISPEEVKELLYLPKEETVQAVLEKTYKTVAGSNPFIKMNEELMENLFQNHNTKGNSK